MCSLKSKVAILREIFMLSVLMISSLSMATAFNHLINYELYVVNGTTWSDGMLIPVSILGTTTNITPNNSKTSFKCCM